MVPAGNSAFATATSSSDRSTTAFSVSAYVAMGRPPAANYTGLAKTLKLRVVMTSGDGL